MCRQNKYVTVLGAMILHTSVHVNGRVPVAVAIRHSVQRFFRFNVHTS